MKECCPHCNADLGDRVIFPGYIVKRKIIVYDVKIDMAVAYRCPDCERTFSLEEKLKRNTEN